jgi:hypothetical protein
MGCTGTWLERRFVWLDGVDEKENTEKCEEEFSDVYGTELIVGSWQLAVGSWQLAVGSWQLAVGSWQLAVGSWQLAE